MKLLNSRISLWIKGDQVSRCNLFYEAQGWGQALRVRVRDCPVKTAVKRDQVEREMSNIYLLGQSGLSWLAVLHTHHFCGSVSAELHLKKSARAILLSTRCNSPAALQQSPSLSPRLCTDTMNCAPEWYWCPSVWFHVVLGLVLHSTQHYSALLSQSQTSCSSEFHIADQMNTTLKRQRMKASWLKNMAVPLIYAYSALMVGDQVKVASYSEFWLEFCWNIFCRLS